VVLFEWSCLGGVVCAELFGWSCLGVVIWMELFEWSCFGVVVWMELLEHLPTCDLHPSQCGGMYVYVVRPCDLPPSVCVGKPMRDIYLIWML